MLFPLVDWFTKIKLYYVQKSWQAHKNRIFYLRNDFSEDDDGHGWAEDRDDAGGQSVQQNGQCVVNKDVSL